MITGSGTTTHNLIRAVTSEIFRVKVESEDVAKDTVQQFLGIDGGVLASDLDAACDEIIDSIDKKNLTGGNMKQVIKKRNLHINLRLAYDLMTEQSKFYVTADRKINYPSAQLTPEKVKEKVNYTALKSWLMQKKSGKYGSTFSRIILGRNLNEKKMTKNIETQLMKTFKIEDSLEFSGFQ